ncbi:hypothetical protein [Paracidovorax avenae]|uniref:hypothetical protein n=1 Tax=Paracidovorax avenae TaxID=80867 RepID=UPI0006B34604|nr:hypothetical protein [Paracidovorax avenae]
MSTSQSTDSPRQAEILPIGERLPCPRPEVPPCPYDVLLRQYHELCPTMTGVRADLFKTGKRADAMLARWRWVMTAKAVVGDKAGQRMATTREEGVEWFRRFFAYAAESAFLRGERPGATGRRWVADLGWLMKLENFEKVLEGKYHTDVQEAEYA